MERTIKYPEYNFSVNELNVYLALAYSLGENWICNPSAVQISKITGISDKTVSKILKKLEDNNLIKMEGTGTGKHYYILETGGNYYTTTNSYLENKNLSMRTKIFLLVIKPHLWYDGIERMYIKNLSKKEICDICGIGDVTLYQILDELKEKKYYLKVGGRYYFNLDQLDTDITYNSLDNYIASVTEDLERLCKRIDEGDSSIAPNIRPSVLDRYLTAVLKLSKDYYHKYFYLNNAI